MKKILITLLVLFAFYKYIFYIPSDGYTSSYKPTSISTPVSTTVPPHTTKQSHKEPNKKVAHKRVKYTPKAKIDTLFAHRRSHVQVESSGRVVKILRDDLKGSRHQKFILRIASGTTILIAHNIDLAPRINGLQKGDTVKFYGQYEWNAKGGVVHWTHKDPRNRHTSGWLRHNGRVYQ